MKASLRRSALALALLPALVAAATAARAACLQELAVYSERESSASIEFRPVEPAAAVQTGAFRVVFSQNDVVLDGFVMRTQGVSRPVGMVTHDCPEGDVTGEEIAACTVWEGVVYAVDAVGEVGLLPAQGEPAAERLLLPDFGPAVRHSSAYGAGGVSIVPWDVFKLSGCQE
jgi:hypothetical protein